MDVERLLSSREAENIPAHFVLAVTLTRVVMSLWHGAGWNFVLFSLFQAVATGVSALAQRRGHGRTVAAAVHIHVVGVGFARRETARTFTTSRLT